MRNDGVPIVGFTWYSITDQMDWDTTLRENNGNVNALGLFDLHRNIRPVGKAYQKLIAEWKDVLPTRSICLRVPLDMPDPADDLQAREQQQQIREMDSRSSTDPAVDQ